MYWHMLFNCRLFLTSNPCRNGGTCRPSFSTNSTKYTCICPPGYGGLRCQKMIVSCRGYKDGNRTHGRYNIFDSNSTLFEVFCDFDSTSEMTWTLIQSYKLQNYKRFKSSFYIDDPINEEEFSWALKYRLSKSRMESIQGDTSKWRLTCNYNEQLQAYLNDYVIALHKMVDILNFNGKKCVDVEYILLRGFNCSNCTAYFIQIHDLTNGLKNLRPLFFKPISSRIECGFRPANDIKCDKMKEHNFGRYECCNTLHDCSAKQSSTTQTWFGG